jgi:3-oxoacyl-[acyl-carrier protein] reductase
MDLGLTGKVFVVTGGSRRLGLATATVLVAEGARVVLAARNPDGVRAGIDPRPVNLT